MSVTVKTELFARRDVPYGAFQRKLLPTVDPRRIIGVRTPELRALAKRMIQEGVAGEYLKQLPHTYFDEDQLHAFIVSETKEYLLCIAQVNRFLPYVDNWATCDQLSPKVFKKHRFELTDSIQPWLQSEHTYTVRFGIGMLMAHYLDADFDFSYPKLVASIRSEEYYVNMMIAWYFATALAKQYEAVLPYIENRLLDPWTHNKAIQKALESYRISPEQKAYLKSLKVKP
ncbi:MAG: DNA alkylation repair protein [Clostridia bacterium]|nr:DNA alkylation repair protein [Clostridia bacterium]